MQLFGLRKVVDIATRTSVPLICRSSLPVVTACATKTCPIQPQLQQTRRREAQARLTSKAALREAVQGPWRFA